MVKKFSIHWKVVWGAPRTWWGRGRKAKRYRSRQDSNLRDKLSTDFKSVALTARPRLLAAVGLYSDYICCHPLPLPTTLQCTQRTIICYKFLWWGRAERMTGDRQMMGL